MQTRSIRRSLSILSGVSLLALAAAMPHAALASDTDVGAPGQALTTGTITSDTGTVVDVGDGYGVQVSAGDNDTVTIDGATINNVNGGSGLSITNYTNAGGALNINFTSANDINAVGGAVYARTLGEDVVIDASGGGSTFGGDTGLAASSLNGDVVIVNGANTFNSTLTALSAGADNGGNVTVSSQGGVISGGAYGIATISHAGDTAIGQDGVGVTTAFSGESSAAISSFVDGSGAIDVTLGAAGTIDGGQYGIITNTTGAGPTHILVEGLIGGQTPTTSTAVSANAQAGGDITITSTAQINGGSAGITATSTGGSGDVTVQTLGVTATGSGVDASTFGGQGSASVILAGAHAISGASGASATTDGAGAASVTSLDAGSSISGATSSGVRVQSAGGAATVDLAGTVHGGIDAIYARNSNGGSITIDTDGAITGMRGVNAQATGSGAITVGTSADRLGVVNATNGDGVYASGGGAVSVYTAAVTTAAGGGVGQAGSGESTNSFFGSGLAIDAISTTGPVTVNAGGLVTGGAGGGVLAQSLGAGNVIITTGQVIATAGGRGIEGYSATGSVNITAGGAVSASADGIFGRVTGTGGVTISAASGVSSTLGNGIRASSTGTGAIAIGASNDRVGAVTGGANGIRAVGGGSTSVYATSVYGVTNGILANAGQSGNVNAQVVVNATGAVTSVNAGRTGVQAYNFGQIGNSSSTVTLTGALIAGGTGIDAQTVNGDVTVTSAAVTAANHNDAWSNGIYVEGGGDSKIAVTTNGAVSGGAGIYVLGHGTAARDTVTVTANQDVTALNGAGVSVTGQTALVSVDTIGAVQSTNGAGIFASGAGEVDVETNTVQATGGTVPAQNSLGVVTGVTQASGYGVAALSTGGAVTVTAHSLVSGGAAGGILAQAGGTGAITINATAVGTTGGRGIEADATGGLISVTTTGQVIGQTAGIWTTNTGAGGIDIAIAGNVTGQTSTGIRANTTGNGTVNIGTSTTRLGGSVTSNGTSGVVGTGGGDVNIYAANVTGATNGIIGQSIQPGANGEVMIDSNGTVTGLNGYGIQSFNNGLASNNSITVHTTGAVTGNGGSAIDAEAVGGDITVHTGGLVSANAGNNNFWSAIYARGGTDGAVSITTDAAVAGTYMGIDAATSGTLARDALTITANSTVSATHAAAISAVGHAGTVTVVANGALTAAGGDGVFASGAGQVNVTTNAVTVTGGVAPTLNGAGLASGVTAFNGYGVAAVSTGGPVTVATNGAVSGGLGGGVLAQNSGTGSVTVTTGNVTSSGGRAIEADGAGGLVTINANGVIAGASDALYASNQNGDIVINDAGGATSVTGSGIRARTNGTGDLHVGAANNRIGAIVAGDAGIRAIGDGSTSVYATTVSGGTNGILANAGQAGAVQSTLVVDVTGAVTSLNAGRTGVQAYNFGQSAGSTAIVNLGGAVNAGGIGVDAETANGDITLTTVAVTGGNNGDAFSKGVLVDGGGDSRISVTTNGAVTGGQGLVVIGEGTQTRDTVTVTANSAVTGQAGSAVFVSGVEAVTVTTHGVTSTGGTAATIGPNTGLVINASALNGFGVAAISTGGAVNLTASGLTQGGAGGGILAQGGGTGSVSVTAGAVSTTGGRGIEADSTGGLVTINATGAVAGQTNGIYAVNTGSGGINIATGGAVTSQTSTGIRVTSGAGAINVGTSAQRLGGAVTSNGGSGITAFGTGDVNVFAGSVTGAFSAINAQSTGVGANGAVVVNSNGALTGLNGFGVIAHNNGTLAANTVSVTTTGAVTATGGTALDAEALGGDVTVVASGVVTANAGNGQYWDAVFAHGAGDSAVSVTTNAAVNGSYIGIDAATTGTLARDTVTVTTNDTVNGAHAAGISAVGVNGLVKVNAVGAVTASGGDGVFASGAGAVQVTTNAVTATGGALPAQANSGAAAGVNALTGYGVTALSTGGAVQVTTNGVVSGGAAGGILAQSAGTGTVTVNTTAAVTTLGGRGIEADAAGGQITVNAGAAVTGASAGLYAVNSGAGGIDVNATSAITGLTSTGLRVTAGSGTINLGSSGQRLASVTGGASGISAFGLGNINVRASSVSGATNGLVAQSTGAGANGTLVIDASGPITGANGFGIVAHNDGTLAANTTTVTTGGVVTATGGTAVDAEGLGGDVTVTTNAAVVANAGNGQYWDAIFAHGAGDSAVSVTTNGAVTGSYIGIDAASAGTAARDTVTVNANAAVTAGLGQAAIQAVSTGLGGVSVTKSASGAVVSNGGIGILASASSATGTSNVTVVNAAQIGGVGAAQTATGIQASVAAGNAGAISIASNTGAIYATGTGISAVNLGSGAVDIGATTGGVSSAINTAGTGIYAQTASGNIAITTAAAGTISPGATIGIAAYSTTGSITILQAGDIGLTGAGNTVGQGIHAEIAGGSGALTVNSTGHIYVTAGTGPTSAGIYAVSAGTGAVNVTSTSVIDPGAYGAYVQGAGNVSYHANGGAVEGDTGVYVQSTGAGTVAVTSTVGTPITGFNGAGIQAVGGSGAVGVTTNGVVTGSTSGIEATSTGTGSTTVVTNGSVVGGTGAGIDIASGTGGLALSVNGNVTSTGAPAIQATSAAGGVINIASGSHVTGQLNTAGEGVIDLTTASGSSTTINVASGAVVSAGAGSAYNVAIKAEGGSVTVNNSGTLVGQVDFSALTGANSGSLNNATGTVFQTGGLNLFNVGNDNFVNAGQIDTVGALTTFDFLGGTNLVTNNGTIRVGFVPSPAVSSFRLVGVSSFTNSGTLTMQNGLVGDSIVANGSVFTGTGASRLVIDANLGAPGAVADTLTVASSAGSTKVVVHDTGAVYGAYNPTGIVVVNGTTHAGDFTLDAASSDYRASLYGGVLDKPGVFFYDLAVNGAGATVLVSAPKLQAEQLTNLGASAQTVWYATAPTSEQFAAHRDSFGKSGSDGPAVWVSAVGTFAKRDHDQSFSTLSKSYSYDTSYDQDVGGVTFGADSAWRGDQNAGGSWLFGVSGGYVSSNTRFNGPARVRMEGAAVSAYASYLNGIGFADVSYTGNFLKAKVSAPDLAGLTGKPDVTSNGVNVQIGLRKPVGETMTFEPTASISYVKTSIDNLATAGETLHYADPESVRAALGVRLNGQAQQTDAWGLSYTVSLRVVDELKGRNDLTFSGLGSDLTLRDDFKSVYGEVSGGLKLDGKGPWSGFVNASWMFDGEYSAPSISLGGRYRF